MKTVNLLTEGDMILIKEGHTIYADVPEHFVYSNKKGCFDLTHTDIKITKEYLYLTGKYIVVKTVFHGGGTGHGPGDVFPNGHHVFCMGADNSGVKIDFYQSGCFTAMIEDIEPTGKAELNWTEKKNN